MKKIAFLILLTLCFSCKDNLYTYELYFTDGTSTTIKTKDNTVRLVDGCIDFNEEDCDCQERKTFCFVKEYKLINTQKL